MSNLSHTLSQGGRVEGGLGLIRVGGLSSMCEVEKQKMDGEGMTQRGI